VESGLDHVGNACYHAPFGEIYNYLRR
jgi:hypothetical protein